MGSTRDEVFRDALLIGPGRRLGRLADCLDVLPGGFDCPVFGTYDLVKSQGYSTSAAKDFFAVVPPLARVTRR